MSEWKRYKLNEIASLSNGINFDKSAYTSGVKLIGVADFKDRVYPDYGSLQEVDSKVVRNGDYLEKGDIVFVRSNGNKALVGRCLVVYPHNTPTTYSGFCIRYRLTSSEVNTAYLLRVLKADSMRKKMTGRGANIQNLNQQILATLDIPLPPIEQQQQFAAFVEQTDKSKYFIHLAIEYYLLIKKLSWREKHDYN